VAERAGGCTWGAQLARGRPQWFCELIRCPVLRVHSILTGSQVNGPGERTIVHFQGCSLGCPGCWNPKTHTFDGGDEWHPAELAEALWSATPSRAFTFSGGEPFQQSPEGLLTLFAHLKTAHAESSVLVYTGLSLGEIWQRPGLARILQGLGQGALIDVLVAGRYNQQLPVNRGLRSSRNQELVFLTNRHSPEEFEFDNEAEAILGEDGSVVITGFPTAEMLVQFGKGL